MWKVPFANGVATTPVVIGERLVVVSAEGEVAAIEAGSGKVVWRVTPYGTLKPLPFIPSPAYAGKRIFVADNRNRILALNPANGAILWRKILSARANTSLIVSGTNIIVGTEDGFLNWIACKSGKLMKRVRLSGIPHGTPVPSGGLLLVLVSSGKSKLVALNLENGEVRWEQETSKEWTTYRPLVVDSMVIVGNNDKNLCAFDRATGERRWCRPVGQIPRGLGISQDGLLYVGSMSGVVQAFRLTAGGNR